MKLICFIPLDDLFAHPFPAALIRERLKSEQFDTDKMILSGVTMDGQKAWYAQERFSRRKKYANST